MKNFVIFIMLTLSFVGISCEKKNDDKVVLTLAGSEAVGSLGDRAALHLRDYVNSKNGELEISYIQGEVLGAIQDVIDQQMQGSVDIVIVRPLWFSAFIDDFQILSWGFTFQDRDHMQRFFDSSLFSGWKDQIDEELGITMLGAAVDQSRVMFSSKPIKSILDIEGLKIRVPHIESYIELWGALGAVPTQIAWSEAFLSLQTGVADAAEADISGAMSQRFHIPAKYIMKTDHVYSGYSFTVNSEKYTTLSDENRKILQEGVDNTLAWIKKESVADSEKLLNQMIDEGAEVIDIDKTKFQDAVKEHTSTMEDKGLWSKGLWQKIQEL